MIDAKPEINKQKPSLNQSFVHLLDHSSLSRDFRVQIPISATSGIDLSKFYQNRSAFEEASKFKKSNLKEISFNHDRYEIGDRRQ